MAEYRKAIAGFVVAFLTTLVAVLQDKDLSGLQQFFAALAGGAVVAAPVFAVSNKPATE